MQTTGFLEEIKGIHIILKHQNLEEKKMFNYILEDGIDVQGTK